MSFSHPSYPEEKEARYQMLLSQSAALLDETLNPIANWPILRRFWPMLCRKSTGAASI